MRVGRRMSLCVLFRSKFHLEEKPDVLGAIMLARPVGQCLEQPQSLWSRVSFRVIAVWL
jgi:hypothetical protein